MANYLNSHMIRLFLYLWQNRKDHALQCWKAGPQNNEEIRKLIANGSDILPFLCALIGGDPVNYDGDTDIEINSFGKSQTSVYGRAFQGGDFIRDFNSSADP